MSREIKFRGKPADNREWVYGYLKKHNDGVYEIIVSSERTFTHNINGKPFYRIISETHDVIPETVGQFTGLHDKNSTETYEDDIVRVKQARGVTVDYGFFETVGQIFFANGSYYIGGQGFPLSNVKSSDFEVIGNIHDNPELLVVTP